MLFSLTLGVIIVAASATLVVGAAGNKSTGQRAKMERPADVYNLNSYRAKRDLKARLDPNRNWGRGAA
jgi:hypothetical protein